MTFVRRSVFPAMLLSTFVLFEHQALSQQAARPNIIVILCDDLGYGDVGFNGNERIRTPHLDRLASEGIRFTNCYSAAPVCSPSRVGLLTGRSPNRAGVYDWIPPGDQPRSDAREQVHMRESEITIPRLLKSGGYATCMAGKWHCNSLFNDPAQPQPSDAGFDHWLATQNNASPSHENPDNYVRNHRLAGSMEGYSCQIAVTEVSEWLGQHKRQVPQRPFFVYLAFHEPHEPVASPAELVSYYRQFTSVDDQAQYFANVENVDRAVGRLLSRLEELGLRDDTLIVFTSDNGPETLNRYRNANRSWGVTGHLRGMKLHTHDGGFHVAGLANWPNGIDGGQSIDVPVSSLDLLPTFCALAEVELPDRHLDGTSLLPLFSGKGSFTRDKPLVWVYYNAVNEARVAMRFGQWKAVARLTKPDGSILNRMQNLTRAMHNQAEDVTLTRFEIYDTSTDPGETRNLADNGSTETQMIRETMKREYADLLSDSPVWEATIGK